MKSGMKANLKSNQKRGNGRPPQRGRRVRVHIENVSTYHPHVQISREAYDRAAARHPRIARQVDVSVGWDFAGFDEHMKDADVLVFMGLDFDPKGFDRRAPKLRWIQMTSAGVEHIMPFDWLPPGVEITNNSGVHAEKHGEFGITAVLMLNNNVPVMTSNQRAARWHTVFGTPVGGKTVAIIGVGSIGGAIARHAKRLGMRVLGVRRSGAKHRQVDEMYRPDQLEAVLPQADFLVATLPLTRETKNLIDARALDLLKPGAGVVNLGRGATMDYEALVRKLERGELSGAVLDAHDPEPLPPSSPLWSAKNVIVSPHCTSSDTERYVPQTLEQTFENLERFLAGRPLLRRVDRALGY
jgi:glyoxylate/hydroxypyruvate reductase A